MLSKYTGKRRKQAITGLLFILPSLAGVMVFVFFPFLDVLCQSFQGPVLREWRGIENYRILFETSAFRLAAMNTLRFTAVCIPVLVVLSLLLAIVLQNIGTSGRIFKSAFLVPMAVPVASVVLFWRVMFHEKGLLNALLAKLGGISKDWMNTGTAFWILVGSYIWKNLGYDIVLWMAGLMGIPSAIYEAAMVDGAGHFQCFLHITLPNLKPMFYTITVLSFLNSFKVFREGYLVAGDYPHESMYLLQHLFNNWFGKLEFDKIASAAVLVVLVITCLILLLKRIWEQEGKHR
ncbi:MAG: sugar ABC transporter permease [Faecalicatena sp.]|uniref:carbohydrate ABC transporter permease n=1 Tax=Faecalicatena sp. TaxID=2005360 RepID=UPI00258480B9|nr:sugar ABC transporter permease [Faecalicatena sp.]MCI6467965.1 sugar ABC transporter permease [Faecalicatena sp.]MDY5619393.1 sugar ABC transporter permease [Lachnospiraceae bacterium]